MRLIVGRSGTATRRQLLGVILALILMAGSLLAAALRWANGFFPERWRRPSWAQGLCFVPRRATELSQGFNPGTRTPRATRPEGEPDRTS